MFSYHHLCLYQEPHLYLYLHLHRYSLVKLFLFSCSVLLILCLLSVFRLSCCFFVVSICSCCVVFRLNFAQGFFLSLSLLRCLFHVCNLMVLVNVFVVQLCLDCCLQSIFCLLSCPCRYFSWCFRPCTHVGEFKSFIHAWTFACLSVCLFVYLCLCVCLCLYLSVCL